ncbi:uncharacterized protein LOC110980661 [Acanthaster planci]|uniref:Uncharacterized protein LOC110980661 n=1 Tax=Acanthaster planci TaxID=133434 RepID=A0A8B7YLC3_ACAPL|nr:uncharacterized protein LOC110980661 [Acanthaster planci]
MEPLIKTKPEALMKYKREPSARNLAALRSGRNNAQRTARHCANQYWLNLCRSIQEAADRGNTRGVYEGMRKAFGPTARKTAPLKSSSGETIIDHSKQMEWWAEHYQDLYLRENVVTETAINSIPSLPVIEELDNSPTEEELSKAIDSLAHSKAPGNDGIQAEVLQCAKPTLLHHLHELLCQCWEEGSIPHDIRNANIMTIYKNKGDRSDCNNYRGISLLSIMGKAFARVALKRLQQLADRVYPESQCGFRAQRSTIDMIFTGRQLQEKCREQKQALYIAFIDLTKAFDSSGVKQGCVLAATLFGIFFSLLLSSAFNSEEDGVYLHTRSDSKLFNLACLQAKTKVHQLLPREMLFADDAALASHSEAGLQRLITCLAHTCSEFGLTISLKKTNVMGQDVSQAPSIGIGDHTLEVVEEFTFLGSTIASNLSLNAEISKRIGRAASTMARLSTRVWENSKLTVNTKISVYNTCVLSTLLYGSETWTAYARQERRLNSFHQRCLQHILGISWQDRVPNTEVLEKAPKACLRCCPRDV